MQPKPLLREFTITIRFKTDQAPDTQEFIDMVVAAHTQVQDADGVVAWDTTTTVADVNDD